MRVGKYGLVRRTLLGIEFANDRFCYIVTALRTTLNGLTGVKFCSLWQTYALELCDS